MIIKTPINKPDIFTSNPKLTKRSKKLRTDMTHEERHLWYDFLKDLPVTVNRQKVFGIYILDFYCDRYKLAIEIDGFHHYENIGKRHDKIRDEYLNKLGIKVLRYSNRQISEEFDDVCKEILENMVQRE